MPLKPPFTRAEAIELLHAIRNLPEYDGLTPDDWYGTALPDEEGDDS